MLHRSIKFAYAVIAVFSTVMAFLVMQNFDEVTVAGPSTVIRMNESPTAVSGQRVTAMLESFATEHRVNIGRELGDVQDPHGVRHLYLAVGDPDAESTAWLSEGYPGFSRSVRTEVHTIEDVSSRDPRAYYLLFGPEDVADELVGEFAGLGLRGWQEPFFTPTRAVQFFGNGALLWCVVIVALVVVVVVGSGVVLNTRSYGVRRLHGHSFAHILAQDGSSLAVYLLRLGAVLAPGVAVLLHLYNGLNQASSFVVVTAGFFLFFAALALASHVVALALVHQTPILGSVKGEVAATSALGGAYLIRVPALFLALAAVVSLLGAGQDVRTKQSQLSAWAQTEDAVYVLLNGSLGDQTAALSAAVGGWIRASGAQQQVFLAHREAPDAFLRPGTARASDAFLVVNGSYLAQHEVVDPSGRMIAGPAPGDGTVRVLIPEQYWADADAIVAGVADWTTFLVGERSVVPPQIVPVRTRDDQSLLTYDATTSADDDARLLDPVVVALPDGSDLVSDDDYTAWATQGGVVFRDGDEVLDSVRREGLSEYVLAVNPVTEQAANEYRDAVRELRLRAVNVLASLAVLVITAISVAVVYCRKNAQALFVKHISGWSFARTYRPVLALELVVAVGLVLSAWNRVAAARSQADGGAATLPSEQLTLTIGAWETPLAGAVAGLGVLSVVVALVRMNRRVIRDGASDA